MTALKKRMTRSMVLPLVFFVKFSLIAAVLLQIAACAHEVEYHTKQAPSASAPQQSLKLRPGDEIELKFPYWQELNDTQIIRPDGYITLQLIDSVKAAGLTPEELDEKLTELYESKIKDPTISVVVRSLVDQRIYVGGEVNEPGLLTLQGDVDPLQAVINAGGFKETARLNDVIVIRKGTDGKAVPYTTDLSSYKANSKQTFLLRPNDVVYVPKTTIANLNKFVNQYVEQLFLFRGIGLGFHYSLDEDYIRVD